MPIPHPVEVYNPGDRKISFRQHSLKKVLVIFSEVTIKEISTVHPFKNVQGNFESHVSTVEVLTKFHQHIISRLVFFLGGRGN